MPVLRLGVSVRAAVPDEGRAVKYVIDTEFIDTPTCSALISLAIVREDDHHARLDHNRYFEFEYPTAELTPWLRENVVPHLIYPRDGLPYNTMDQAAAGILDLVDDDPAPEFWAYYGAYDWYWFARVFGGFMRFPKHWPMLHREFAYIQQGVPNIAGAEHHALNDCYAILEAMRSQGIVR